MRVDRCLIVPAKIEDVYRLSANLRDGDRLEITGLGLEPRTVLRNSFRNAVWRRSAFIDGELAAMWGLGGAMLADEGTPWLMTTPIVERMPITFLKVARAQLSQMLRDRLTLSNIVLASYIKACRLLEILGFTLDEPQPLGPNGMLYRKFWIRR